MSERLIVERLPGPDALEDIAAEWDQLDRQISPRTPYTAPAWIIPWWKHLSRYRRMVFHDEFFCHVVRGDNGRLIGVAPLMRSCVPGIGPPLLRIVQFFGADAALTEIRGLICRQEDQTRVVEALIEHFLARRGEWDVFRWAGLREPVDFYSTLRPHCDFLPRSELPDYIVELPVNWEDLRLRISCNMRRKLRKAYESLERDGIAFTLRVTERPHAVEAAMHRFLTLHAARAEATGMILHENKFERPRVRAFIADYLQGAAERGELRIFELEIGGDVVASRLAFLFGPDMWMHLSGYDPAWKTYSVMTVLTTEMIRWSFAKGVARINLSTGRDQSKMGWRPREVLFRDAVQVSPTWRARPAFAVFRVYETVNEARIKAKQRSRSRRQPVDPAQREFGDRSVQDGDWSAKPL